MVVSFRALTDSLPGPDVAGALRDHLADLLLADPEGGVVFTT